MEPTDTEITAKDNLHSSLFANNIRSKLKMTSDKVFYMVYGEGSEKSNRALAALLNVVLHMEDDPITSVKVLNTVDKGFWINDKETVMDIKATCSSGRQYNVEMQAGHLDYYENRSLFYGGRMINSSLATGENYGTMKESIVVSFIDGILFPKIEDLHTDFGVLEKKKHFLLTDRLSVHFLELGKLDQEKEPEDMTPEERLCAYLLCAGNEEKEDYLKKLFDTQEEVVKMSENRFREITEDERVQEWLWRQEVAKHDAATRMDMAKREGRAEGRDEVMQAFVELCNEMEMEPKDIQHRIMEKFNLTEKEADEYMNKYK